MNTAEDTMIALLDEQRVGFDFRKLADCVEWDFPHLHSTRQTALAFASNWSTPSTSP